MKTGMNSPISQRPILIYQQKVHCIAVGGFVLPEACVRELPFEWPFARKHERSLKHRFVVFYSTRIYTRVTA